MTATYTTTATTGSANATIVDPFLIIEIRDNLLAEVLAANVDTSGQLGAAHLFPNISNSFTPGDPLSAIANGASEADAVTDTALTTSYTTLTPAVKAAYVVNSKVNEKVASVDWDTEIRALLARAAADMIDYDLLALNASLTPTGTTNERITTAIFRAAMTAYRLTAKSHANRVRGVLHTKHVGHIMDELFSGSGAALSVLFNKVGAASLFGEDVAGTGIMEATVGMLLGVPLLQSTNVPYINSTTDYAGALITPPRGPTDRMATYGKVTKWSAEVEKYNLGVLAMPAYRYGVDLCYAVGIINSALGRGITARVAD